MALHGRRFTADSRSSDSLASMDGRSGSAASCCAGSGPPCRSTSHRRQLAVESRGNCSATPRFATTRESLLRLRTGLRLRWAMRGAREARQSCDRTCPEFQHTIDIPRVKRPGCTGLWRRNDCTVHRHAQPGETGTPDDFYLHRWHLLDIQLVRRRGLTGAGGIRS